MHRSLPPVAGEAVDADEVGGDAVLHPVLVHGLLAVVEGPVVVYDAEAAGRQLPSAAISRHKQEEKFIAQEDRCPCPKSRRARPAPRCTLG